MKIKTMQAAILVEQNKPLVIDEVELPSELDFGQVLVQVHYSGICGSQLGEISGVKGLDAYLPHLLGHEGSGTVVETGPNVTHVKVDDHVVLHWRPGEGIESCTPKYLWKGKTLNAGFVTTFNEYAVVSENRLTKIPRDFNMEIGALFGCAVTTGLGVINNNAKVKIGESIVLFGAGGIGLNIIQGAVMVSAYPIVAIDLFDHKLDLAKKLGATHIINSKKMDVRNAIYEIIGEFGADVVIDNTGNTDIIHDAYELTNAEGRTILVGVPRKGEETKLYTLPLHFEKILTGSHGGESKPDKDIPKYINLYKNGILKLDKFITQRYKLEQINDAIADMQSGKITGRCTVKLNR